MRTQFYQSLRLNYAGITTVKVHVNWNIDCLQIKNKYHMHGLLLSYIFQQKDTCLCYPFVICFTQHAATTPLATDHSQQPVRVRGMTLL